LIRIACHGPYPPTTIRYQYLIVPAKNVAASFKLFKSNAQAEDTSGLGVWLLTSARLGLSARGYHRVLRVARTLADMDLSDGVTRLHVAEALSFRRLAPGRGAVSGGGAARG
jgi:predicted ATPase with chaperone activity